MRRPSPLVAIFLTVFIDLLGFGLVIPDLQLRGAAVGLRGQALGLALGAFSLAQLLTSPYLGRLSDRIGRRPVLLVTTVLAVVSYLFYANADTVWEIVVARILNGIAGANLGVAFAYVADVTKPAERAKGMGLIGAAFGLGFILGPVFGAQLITIGENRPLLLGYAAAAISLVNFVYLWFWLPEPERHETAGETTILGNMRHAFRTPALALLLAMAFATNLGFTHLESTYFRLLAAPGFTFSLSDLGAKQAGAIILACVGVVGVIMQGFVVRKTAPRFGEPALLRFGYFLQVPALALVPFMPLWLPALGVVVLLGVGGGLVQPSISSLVSRSAPPEIQGGIFGVTQALGALARFVGPQLGNALFEVKPWLPYAVGAALISLPMMAAWRVRLPEDKAAAH